MPTDRPEQDLPEPRTDAWVEALTRMPPGRISDERLAASARESARPATPKDLVENWRAAKKDILHYAEELQWHDPQKGLALKSKIETLFGTYFRHNLSGGLSKLGKGKRNENENRERMRKMAEFYVQSLEDYTGSWGDDWKDESDETRRILKAPLAAIEQYCRSVTPFYVESSGR
ncbi:hypothetical protein [Inquilinus sp. Marseille-Q2685]|uniref:hypothetical protein n=1 Tax=Inquilinus sp. Marseille-Q2685 TaxID=2866581 RepID=UPI001CE40FF0|nr:hypothetical protein [Inquilinus sp. Marseille-Q2685]